MNVTDSTIVLGIETSCDETAAALVMGGHDVLSSVVSTQVDLHAQYGGVVPEIASRAHLDLLNPVIARAITNNPDWVTPCRLPRTHGARSRNRSDELQIHRLRSATAFSTRTARTEIPS